MPDDAMALKLFEKNELDFLKRLPTQFIPIYQNKSEYLSIPAFRFDFIGFGSRVKDDLFLRKALIYSIDYEKSRKLFSSSGRFGCPSLNLNYYDTKPYCYEFDPQRAQAYLEKSNWKKNKNKQKPLELVYSTQGGEDHRKMADWLQIEWQKNLGLRVETKSVESRIFLSRLKKDPPDLFRRGLASNQPTCRSLLMPFLKSSSENLLKHFDFEFDEKRFKLGGSELEDKTQCRNLVEKIMSSYVLIPTGQYEHSALLKSNWRGFSMNTLQQLDLGELTQDSKLENKQGEP
jgi:oligopeptide transport system substrate-binding protein